MARRPAKIEFIPRNPGKYQGSLPIICRSSWEANYCAFLDGNSAVLMWQSESISIPYRNPLTGKWSVYIPDFFVVFRDPRTNKTYAELIEIKPEKENPFSSAKKGSPYTQATAVINYAKWQAATQFAVRNGFKFRVLTA